MKLNLADLDGIVLSHWHRDRTFAPYKSPLLRLTTPPDSGGILKALDFRSSLCSKPPLPPVPIDLQPTRPFRRGIAPPPKFIPTLQLPPDPTFDELIAAGGKVDLHDEDHEIVGRDGQRSGVGVSGEIKRQFSFERGLPGAVTWMRDEDGKEGWFTDDVGSPPTSWFAC